MTNIAILGFGVVGSGVADLLTKNADSVRKISADEINIKYILDLRDFPDSPFGDRVVHDFSIILNDTEVSCVIEAMGGSHPAYEYTSAALKAGKSVITSNKEVVAKFGDEFLTLAKENDVCYRFEAAVGGGIPVISPIIDCVRHNAIKEIRGILNGTTNYILTKMFSFGDSFEDSLKDAQEKGYAERNPDADVLGIDACRKITILTALATGKLLSTEKIHTEGITSIRSEDVSAAEALGMKIKLLGRCILKESEAQVMVAPFMLSGDSPLACVNGVYNAVEVIGEPVNNVMFYGRGAGAGPTASAIVADLMQVLRSGRNYACPEWVKDDSELQRFSGFECAHYVALSGVKADEVKEVFGSIRIISEGDEIAFTTEIMSENECSEAIRSLTSKGAELKSRIRIV